MGAYFSFLFFFFLNYRSSCFLRFLFSVLFSVYCYRFFFFGYSNSNVNKRWYIHVYSLRRLQPVFYRNVVCKKKKLFFFLITTELRTGGWSVEALAEEDEQQWKGRKKKKLLPCDDIGSALKTMSSLKWKKVLFFLFIFRQSSSSNTTILHQP